MKEIAIHRIRLLERSLDGNPVLLAVRDHFRATGKLFPEGIDLPRSQNLQRRRKRHVGQLKAALIVALAGRTVGNGIRLLLLRDFNLSLRNQRPGD